MGIRCGELLSLAALKDIQLVGGENGLDRIVDWIYFGDVIDDLEDGVNWINGNEIVIITGASVKGEYFQLQKMLPKYNSRGIAGILISIGKYFADIPQEIVDEANRLSLPVFMLPWEVKLVDATRSICNAIIANEVAEHESANILDSLLFGSLGSHEHLSQLLARANYSLNHSYRVCILDMKNVDHYAESGEKHILKTIRLNLLRIAHSVFDYYTPKTFLSLKGNMLIFLIASESHSTIVHAIEQISSSMQKSYPLLHFKSGVGKSYRHPEKLPYSYQQAKQALQEALIDESIPSPVFYSEDDIYSLLFNIKDQELLRAYSEKILNPLYEYEKNNNLELLETLDCYLTHELRVSESAIALCVHKNTMKYRLAKIQEILSVNLKDPSVISSIYIAIKIHNLLKSDIQDDVFKAWEESRLKQTNYIDI